MPDRDSAPWWEAVRRHELLVQKCLGRGTLRLPPCAICNACQCRDAAWVPAAGTGTVQSWIVSHHVFMRSMAAEAPYAVALVRLDDGDDLLLYGNIVAVHDSGGPGDSGDSGDREITAADPGTITAGMPVQAVFADVQNDCTLVMWRSHDKADQPAEGRGMAGNA